MPKKELELVKIPDEVIVDRILVIRNIKVMLDRDLADLYGVTTKRLNEQVKRNLKRFPEDFMFQISPEEKEQLILLSQRLTSLKYSSFLPYVFTEHGAVMLASILNSEQAIAVNIQIVRVFTQMRQRLLGKSKLRLEIEMIRNKMEKQDKNIELVFNYLDELLEKREKVDTTRKRIGYKPDEEE